MNRISLLSTDFDGTLIGFESEQECPQCLGEVLLSHHLEGGVWVVNTGRSLDHMLEGLEHFCAPVTPDFLIVNERHIYRNDGEEWGSHAEWNDVSDEIHRKLFEDSRPLLEKLENFCVRVGGVQLVDNGDGLPGLITDGEDRMQEVVRFLDSERFQFPGFDYQRNSIYLRFSHQDYSKGSALSELRRVLRMESAAVLAVGDNFNDLSMLQREHAECIACPANAVSEVKLAVLGGGGYVAGAPFARGTAEACLHFRNR